MAHSLIKKRYIFTSHSNIKKILLCGSVIFALSSCDNSGVTNINGAFSKNWDEIARSQGVLENETSHMQSNQPTSVNRINDTASTGAPDIIPAPVDTSRAQMAKYETPYSSHTSNSNSAQGNLNYKNMFGADLASDQERLDRLERAVQDMRNDFSRVEPSIRRLMALESDIQSLIRELEKLNSGAPAPAKTAVSQNRKTKPRTARTTPSSSVSPSKGFVKKSAPPLSNTPSIYDIRIGEHSDKTRIVMDVNAKTSFNVDIDNNENIMIVDLPDTQWDAKMSQNFAKSPNIKSFTIEQSGDGNLAIFQLKRDAKVTYKADLKGFEGSSRRLVIDVSGV